MELTGSQILLESLKLEGVDTVFGYPGGAVINIYDDLYDSSLNHVLTRHEQAAVHAADGYARCTGKVESRLQPAVRGNQHRNRNRNGLYGFDSDGYRHRSGADAADRQ